MLLDWPLVLENECDKIGIKILDSVNFSSCTFSIEYQDGTGFYDTFSDNYREFSIIAKPTDDAYLQFQNEYDVTDVVIVEVAYFKNGKIVGSSLVSDGVCPLSLLKYKVELPRGAKVTLFDDATIEAKYLAWNITCPRTLANMTFLQVKAANGFEQQLTPSPGSQAIELYMELGRRYAVFGEIWTYSFAQVLWFADLRVQLSDDSWQNCIPTAGEGGTIVTALPQ